jgi:hypothetical protein
MKKQPPRLAVLFSTLEDGHNESKAQVVNIPDHSAVFLRVKNTMYRVSATASGNLEIRVHMQMVTLPRTSNCIEVLEETFT